MRHGDVMRAESGSMERALNRLRTQSPALISSTRQTVICATTRLPRSVNAAAGKLSLIFRAGSRSRRVLRNAGKTPRQSAQKRGNKGKSKTRQSSGLKRKRNRAGVRLSKAGMDQYATSSPPAPPIMESIRLSVNAWRIILDRLAPRPSAPRVRAAA